MSTGSFGNSDEKKSSQVAGEKDKNKTGQKKKKKKKKKKKGSRDDDEVGAGEDTDEGDMESREVDYMTDSSSNSEQEFQVL